MFSSWNFSDSRWPTGNRRAFGPLLAPPDDGFALKLPSCSTARCLSL